MIGRRQRPRAPAASGLLVLLLALPGLASADSIDPDSVEAKIVRGETISIHKTVTVSMDPPSTAPVDVFFLFDTTGSMDPFLNATKAASATILAGTAGLGDLAYGVGSYEDFPLAPFGGITDLPYQQVQDLSSSVPGTIASIASLDTGFGDDRPESQLHALTKVATTTSWRADSTRVVVWFGDAPGHDGTLEAGYPLPEGLGDTIQALQAENITVQAIDVGAPPPGLDETGQATAITDATGGMLFDGIDPMDPDALAAMVIEAISDVVLTYQTVELEVVGDTDNTTVEILPHEYEGDFDRRDGDREFDFVVDITGHSLGVDEFEIRALVDGVPIAVETDRIEVIPEPSAVAFFGLGSLLVSAAVRRRSRP
ncbi:MAG: PEP-CTERM sorting domain-containing protein [Myxococcota bacterium]|nr:PEP-CTERM sorting domain-containing protein [Myxococcota bacterium]